MAEYYLGDDLIVLVALVARAHARLIGATHFVSRAGMGMQPAMTCIKALLLVLVLVLLLPRYFFGPSHSWRMLFPGRDSLHARPHPTV